MDRCESASLINRFATLTPPCGFRREEVLLEDTDLQVGDIPLAVAGTVNLDEGYNLTAAIPQVSIANVTTLLETELPVEAAGEFQFDGTVTGPLDQPQMAGRLENTGLIQADQVALEILEANFVASARAVDLQTLRVVPAAGGFLTASGQVDLENSDNIGLNIDFQTDLPADAPGGRLRAFPYPKMWCLDRCRRQASFGVASALPGDGAV